MTSRIQGLISDHLNAKRIAGGEDYAQEVASVLSGVEVTDESKVKIVLESIRTDIFRFNRHVKKHDVIQSLSKIIVRKGSTSEMSNTNTNSTILFLAADPSSGTGSSAARLMLDEEIRVVKQKIRSSDYRDSLKMEIGLAARADDLIQLCNEVRPRILHFSGHGSQSDGICFVDDDGQPFFLSPEATKRLFKLFASDVKLVVLNACFSENQATIISEHIDFTIGMDSEIDDDAAAIFSASLYRALGFGKTIQNAFDQSMAALAIECPSQQDKPMLFSRKGMDPSSVRLVRD